QVLKSVTKKISENNVGVLYGYEWKGFSGSKLIFDSSEERKEIESDIVIFCLGGASWPVTGSKGDWLIHFKSRNISVKPFLASNCVFLVDWPADFIKKAEGKVLKNIQITCNGKTHAGEVVVTKSGIEGSGIYPLSPQIRNQLMNGNAQILIDLKPQIELKTISAKIIAIIGQKNFSDKLKSELNLDSVTLQLLKCVTSKSDFLNPDTLAKNIKALPLMIKGTGPIEDAISTTGGISLEEIDDFQLKKMPQHYVIGEMLDYDAPTGGYLLQSCFSMSKYLADKLNTL
ncbi:MAG: TIGR03862 family flavoprotein, partial [Kaistella sp.]